MTERPPFTDEEADTLRALHGQGKSCGKIAEAMGRPVSTVSEHAARLGLKFDRSQTAAATAAKQADNAARRAQLVEWQYLRCLKIAGRLDAEKFKTTGQTQFGLQAEELDFVPTGDELNLSRAISSYLKGAADLEKIDASAGTEGAKGMLGDLVARLRSRQDSAGD